MPQRRESFNRSAGVSLALAALALGIGLTGCQRDAARGAPPAPEVAVVTVATQPVVLTTELPGRVAACRTAEIRPQVSGVVMKRLFTEGAVVRSGQVLYQVDPATYQAALDNAKATLARAEAQLPALRQRAERVASLLPDRAVSQQDVDDTAAALHQAEAEVNVWKAAVAAAAVNLAHCRITAPVTGSIGRSTVTEGALVSAYQPVALATIQQIDSVYVDVTQSTSDVLTLRQRMQSGQMQQGSAEVSLVLEDASPYPHKGVLRFREVTTDPSTGSVVLRAIFPNPDAILLPGMFVHALVDEGRTGRAGGRRGQYRRAALADAGPFPRQSVAGHRRPGARRPGRCRGFDARATGHRRQDRALRRGPGHTGRPERHHRAPGDGELTEARDAVEILPGTTGLRLGDRDRHHGRRRVRHRPVTHLPVPPHRAAVDRGRVVLPGRFGQDR
jgi:membrane fusion protein (multidrug efflux system)